MIEIIATAESIEQATEDDSLDKGKTELSNKPLLVLRNDQERKDFLDTWASWKVMCRVPKLNLVVREYVLPDDSRILSLDFGEFEVPCWNSSWVWTEKMERVERKQLLQPGEKFSPESTSTTLLIAHLRDVVPNR